MDACYSLNYYVLVILGLSYLALEAVGETCTKLSACSCKTSKGHVVSLESLSNDNNGGKSPFFKDVTPQGDANNFFSFNPCTPFTEQGCSNAAICQTTISGPVSQTFALGSPNNVEFEVDGDVINMKYSDGQAPTTVHLKCEKNIDGNFIPLGDTGGKIELDLNTKHACLKKSGTLSIGSIILIAVAGIVVLYLIGGIIYQLVIKREKGMGVIPNRQLWTSIPGYVKDGTLFVVRRGKYSKSYSKI